MPGLGDTPLHTIRADLLKAVAECRLRGLSHSAKWSAEIACALPPSSNDHACPIVADGDKLFVDEYSRYSLAQCYFDCKEFGRAAHHLKACQSRQARFLYYYARYLDGEKKMRYQMADILNANRTDKADNPELLALKHDLEKEEGKLDGYCYYLSGVVLKSLGLVKQARENFECAIQMEPTHWGAWEELAATCKDRESLKELRLPEHWMSEFFYAYAELELHMNEEAINRYQFICASGFSHSLFVKSQIATANYNMRDFDTSVEQLKELHELDPHMLEHLDTYSNILYIQDARSELSYLAHHVCSIDKYRTESCAVIGNYYSLRGDHEKAVVYFRQALRLNPKYVAAWTLLGHEHVELKNISAAIESYRRATEVNPRDYRAWHGLGHTYELLKMPFYSLFYYKEAQKLRPNDARMLIALGDTYQNLDKAKHAKTCYLRAVRLGDADGQATIKLAKLRDSSGEEDEAAKLYAGYLDRLDSVYFPSSEDVATACLFLARYNMRRDRYNEAETYARKATEYNESREEGMTLLQEISNYARITPIQQI